MIGSLLINDHIAVMNDDGRWDCEYIPARIILRAQFAIPAEHSEADGQFGHRQIAAAADFFGVQPVYAADFGGVQPSKAWDESQHPRDEGGRFATSDSNDGPDSGNSGDQPKAEPKPPALPPKIAAAATVTDIPKQDIPPNAGYDELRKHAEVGTEDLKDILDRGKGIGSQLGFKTVNSEQEFNDALKEPGGIVVVAPPKGQKRAEEKVRQELNGDWSQLLDASRATVAVDSLEELDAVLKKLEASDMQVVRASDRFTNPTDVGYRDIKLNVKTPNDGIGELQLHVKSILVAKNEAHHHYEVMRSIAGKAAEEKRDMTAEEAAAFNEAKEKSAELYSKAWKKAAE
jgi:hypothetical protein